MKKLNELRSLLNLAQALGQTPDPKLVAEVERLEQREARLRNRIRKNMTEDLKELNTLTNTPSIPPTDIPIKDPLQELADLFATLGKKPTVVNESTEPVVITRITNPESNPEVQITVPVEEHKEPEPLTESIQPELSLVDKVAKTIKETVVSQGDPVLVDPTNNLELKVKQLEAWVSRIAATGTGSGEVNFRWLDDVDRTSIGTGKYLTYDPASKKFTFKSISGGGGVGTLDDVTTNGNITTNDIFVGAATVDHVNIRTAPTSAVTVTSGTISWNNQVNTFDLGLLNGVVLQVGQETHMYVKASEPITNGQTVMFAGTTGEHIQARRYDPTVPGFIPEWFIGVATQNFTVNEFGYITVYGLVHDINTNSYNSGDILYVDNTVVGGLTTAEPAPGTPHIMVAAVTKKSATGHIMVRPSIRSKFGDLPDLNITSAVTGQTIVYNGGYWINTSLSNLYTTNANLTSILSSYTTNANLTSTLANYTFSNISWTNPSPAPGSPWRTSIIAGTGVATIALYTGLPGFGSVVNWNFDTDKITFPDGTIQTTAWTSNLLSSYTTNSNLTSTLASYTLNTSLTSTLASYTTNANLTSTLSAYATNTFVTAALTSYTTNANLTSTLTNYTTNANLTSTLASYATNANLTSTLTNYTTNDNLTSTLSNYATKLFVTSALTSYTLNASLTSTLASYATKTFVTSALTSYQLITSSLSVVTFTANTITATGNASILGTAFFGTSSFTKAGYATGDILIDNGATDTPGVMWYYANNTNFGADCFYGSGGEYWRIVKNLNESGGVELLQLNASGNLTLTTGSLIQANRPAFRVIGNGGQISSTTTVTNAHWTMDYQQGTGLNTSTGIFTAPLAGLYQVNVLVRTYSNTNPGINQVLVYKVVGTSTTVQLMVEFGTNTSMNHAGGSTISKLNAGEQLKFVVSAGTISFDSNDNWSVAYLG